MKLAALFNTTKLAAITLAAIFSTNVSALTITDLYNTGVDDSGALLANYANDTHYDIISAPAGFTGTDWALPAGYPIGPWVANDSNSRWISPNATYGVGPIGSYTYRTTFNLAADAILSSVSIIGKWATDDPGPNIRINGIVTGEYSPTFTSYDNFSITSGFQIGLNTIDFLVYNHGGPTGLRVDDMIGTYDATSVPEPSSLALLGLGLAGIGFSRRKKKA